MAVTLSQSEINDLAKVLGVGQVRENVEEGSFSAEDGRAILTARGHTIEQITGVIPDDEGFGFIPDVVESINTATSLITSGIHETITDYNQLLTDITANVTEVVREEIDENLGHVIQTRESLHNFYSGEIAELNQLLADQADGYEELINKAILATRDEMLRAEETSEQSILGSLLGAFDTQARALADSDTAIKDVVTDAAVQTKILIDDVEENVRGVATAIKSALPDVATSVMSGESEITSGFPSMIGDVLGGLLEGFWLDKVVTFFELIGHTMEAVQKERGKLGDISIQEGSWDVPRSGEDLNNIWTAVFPIIGQFALLDHPAEFERLRLDSFAWTRPTPLDQGSVLEFIRRFPNRRAEVNESLERAG